MNWFDWTIAGYLILGALLTVALIGKPRKPIDPATAVLTIAINGALIAGLLVTR